MREATMNETATLSHILDVVGASHEASFDAAEAVARWRTGEASRAEAVSAVTDAEVKTRRALAELREALDAAA